MFSRFANAGPRVFILAAAALFSFQNVKAQTFPQLQCTFNAAVTPTVRVEGLTERVGDVIVTCTGGTPTAPGMPVPAADINLSFNANVTSRAVSGYSSEALLLIDEP